MKRVHVVIAASLSVAMVLAGMYAVAATTAAAMAAGFSTTESTNRMQIVTFGATLKQAAAEHRAGSARCKVLARAERDACAVAVTERDKYAFSARMPWKPSGR